MQHESQSVPVTALAVWRKQLILAGEGTHLSVYDANSTPLCRVRVFQSQAIHGIVIHEDEDSASPSNIVVWGGAQIRTAQLSFRDDAVLIEPGDVYSAPDWILDAAYAPSIQPLVGIVTAHNALLVLRFPLKSLPDKPNLDAALESHAAGSNCILYSAQITWLSSSQCLIASGTAFGDVIVWSVILNQHDPTLSRKQTHYCFSAHEGSVFGVRISPELKIPVLGCSRLLLSCSDDRTIRLWDIADLKRETQARLDQDTGFQYDSNMQDGDDLPHCLAKAMGHISRIWHVRYDAPRYDEELLRVLSFGEDASVITWALKSAGSTATLQSIDTVKVHAGKHIWSLASDLNFTNLVTGGADACVALSHRRESHGQSTEIPQPMLQGANQCDNYRAYAFLDDRTLIATTDRGRVVRVNPDGDGSTSSVTELLGPSRGLNSYSVISAASSMGFISGVDGTIYAYSHASHDVFEMAELHGKVCGLFACAQNSGSVKLLACAVNTTTAKLYDILEWTESHRPLIPQSTMELEVPHGFITVSFTYHADPDAEYTVLGSRSGSIAIYRHSSTTQTPLSCSKLKLNCHGKEAVTALHWTTDPGRHARETQNSLLFSTGRDGTFAVHSVNLSHQQIELHLIHQLELPFGPNVEGLCISNDSNPWAWGFRSKHFIVYDLAEQREIMTVDCGGVHRNWTFQPSDGGGRFIWTKASHLFQASQASLSHTLINPGGHGREIKAMAIADEKAGRLIATGAEDTNIKLFKLQSNGFRCMQTLRKHNTGIQHLAWLGRYLFSSGGFEEFFIWRVTLDIPHVDVGVVCESAHPRSGGSDLRIMGFDVYASSNAEDGEHASGGFTITMAYSDSALKQWRYSPPGGRGSGSWELIASGDYLTSCLTHVFRLAGPDNDNTLWTAATDGHIAAWTIDSTTQTLSWSKRHKIHQSAIHDLTCHTLPNIGETILATGGDDNAVGITRINSAGDVCTLVIPRAHAAAVTVLATVWLGAHGCVLASVGLDQRVKIWRITTDFPRAEVEAVNVVKVYDVFTAVADASSLGVCSLVGGGTGLLVGGVGLQLWRLNDTTASGTGSVEVVDDEQT